MRLGRQKSKSDEETKIMKLDRKFFLLGSKKKLDRQRSMSDTDTISLNDTNTLKKI